MNEKVKNSLYIIHICLRFLIINTSGFVWAYLLYQIIGNIDLNKKLNVDFSLLNSIGFILVWFITCYLLAILFLYIGSVLEDKSVIVQRYLEFIKNKEKKNK